MRKVTSWFRTATVALTMVAAACAAGPGTGTGTGPTAMRDRDVIGPDELATVEVRTTALQMIQRLRPFWLRSRGPVGVRNEPPIPVYVNNQRVSESAPLERYTAGELLELRFLNASLATQRFGTGHPSGAILLTLR